MTIDAKWLDQSVKKAVKEFWRIRDGGQGVRSGKTLDAFLEIVTAVVKSSGLSDVEVFTGKTTAQLPGFFRPHKTWDAVILSRGRLVAALELKSQIGSIGNNFNNRSEEVLGSSIDLQTAIEELAFGDNANIYTGYIIIVEKSEKTEKNPRINMKSFPVMEGFLMNEKERNTVYQQKNDGTYPGTKGISYLERYDLMCKRLMIKHLYTAAAVVAVPDKDYETGSYENLSPETSIQTFMLKLANHCQVVASITSQKSLE